MILTKQEIHDDVFMTYGRATGEGWERSNRDRTERERYTLSLGTGQSTLTRTYIDTN